MNNSDQENQEVPIDSQRLLLDGVSESCSNEMIQLYLTLMLNYTLDDQIKVEEMRRNRFRVMVKLNRPFDFDEVKSRQQKLPIIGDSRIKVNRVRVSDTLRLTDLATSCSKELLNLYFSNTKISQGGDVKSIRLFVDECKALIQFKDYRKCDDVLSKTHIVCDKLVKLEKFYELIEDECFLQEEEEENKQESSSKMLDLFETHQREKSTRLLSAPNALKSFSTPQISIDKTKLILANIQENTCIQQIDFLVQLITGKQEINEINWSLEHKGKLLIDFRKEIDINKVLDEFAKNSYANNLNGRAVQLETVNVTRTLVVLVKDFKQSRPMSKKKKLDSTDGNGDSDEEEYKPESIPATRDLLELYFSNKSRSGGGEVESIERKSSRYWLVHMKDHRSVRSILARRHIVDEKPIKVFPHYENFGLPYLFKPIFDEQQSSSSTAAVFKLKINDDRLRYFCKVKNLHKKLNEILAESNAVSKYNKNESNILYINYIEKVKTRVPYMERMWRLKVKESLEYFLQLYKFEKLTLSFNQWSTICKAKQINDELLFNSDRNRRSLTAKSFNRGQDEDDEDDEELSDDDSQNGVESNQVRIFDAPAILRSSDKNKVKYIGHNCAIISINETDSNIELSIVGPNVEVDRFIVRIKDIICKAYFTFELEEKIIKFKTYLYECEELLAKWLNDSSTLSSADVADSDAELTLASARSNNSDTLSIAYKRVNTLKLTNSRRSTIDEFISKLERDHLDMELSYGKLFQELGYTFLNSGTDEDQYNDSNDNNDDDENRYDDYKEFNEKVSSSLDETVKRRSDQVPQSQMDKIKYTLNDLRVRINEMRKKFRQFVIKSKRNELARAQSRNTTSENEEELDEEQSGDDKFSALDDKSFSEYDDDTIKLSVYVKEQSKIMTFRVHRKCKVRELKQILLEKCKEDTENRLDETIVSVEHLHISYNGLELSNSSNTISDYGINDKATLTLTFKNT